MPYADPAKKRERAQEWRRDHPLTEEQRAKGRAATKRWIDRNKEAVRERRIAKYHENRPEMLKKMRDQQLRTHYGITAAQYDEMFKRQGGVCLLCGGTSTDGKRLAVDHCHASESVRGLLCNMCNRGLGCFRDRVDVLERAADYLRRRM
jgi:hypothetical protein